MSKAEVYNHMEPEEPTPWWFWVLVLGALVVCLWSLSVILKGFPL